MTAWDDGLPDKAKAAMSRATDKEKESALKDATSFIDTEFKFRGEKQSNFQALSWPRKNAFFDDGSPIHGVPDPIKEATNLLAGFMLGNVPMDIAAMAHLFAILSPVIVDETKHLEPFWIEITHNLRD